MLCQTHESSFFVLCQVQVLLLMSALLMNVQIAVVAKSAHNGLSLQSTSIEQVSLDVKE